MAVAVIAVVLALAAWGISRAITGLRFLPADWVLLAICIVLGIAYFVFY